MKNTKQVFPIIFVVILAIGLFFVVRANDRQTEKLAESSSLAAEQAKTTINTEDTTLITTENSSDNTESEGTALKFTDKSFIIEQKSKKKVKYPITAVLSAKRVVKYFFDDLKTNFNLNDKINSYYEEINNDKTFTKNTIFLAIVNFENSNSKISVSAVKYRGNEVYIDITETKAKKPDKKSCQKMYVVNIADKDCNAKAMQKINVNIIKK